MRALVIAFASFSMLVTASLTMAQSAVFFEEQFNGPSLDSAVWRTEMLTSGPRVCNDNSGPWSPGHWIEEGEECHGVAAQSPYGSATFSDGLLHLSSSNVRAFPVPLSRLPGAVPMFPASGDFSLTIRLRFDRVTPWGVGLSVYQTASTEPVGESDQATGETVLLQLWCDGPGVEVWTALGGSITYVADVPSSTEFHQFVLNCAGDEFTITADDEIIFGPVASDLRPTAVMLGNPLVAFWYPTDWTSFSIDELRVEVPGPVPVVETSWGTIKALSRDGRR